MSKDKRKTKLHELLAVEGDRAGLAKKTTDEAIGTFLKRADHFKGHIKTLAMFDDVRQANEGGETDRSDIVDTVLSKLSYALGPVSKYYDVVLQKEATNQNAIADLIVDGETLAEGLPATFLLGLESKLKSVRELVEAIPTLAPGIAWEKDPGQKDGVLRRVHPEETFKDEKEIQNTVLVPPTFPKEGEGGQSLPAQIHTWNDTKKVGKYTREEWCSMISVHEKSTMLGRVDKLISGVKKARQRANDIPISDKKVGKAITDYILG